MIPGLGRRGDTDLPRFERELGHRFRNRDRLIRALTHRSHSYQAGLERQESNERLEFLGDSVLGLIINESLVQEFPGADEGALTKTKSILASRAVLAEVSRFLNLGDHLRLSENEVESGGRDRDSILADAFEALLGALYLDGGLEAARRVVHRCLLERRAELLADDSHRNYKSQLQERVQSLYKSPPRYRVKSTSGPDHSKAFVVEVLVQGEVLGRGEGMSKKDAEQDAAREALESFPGGDEPPPEALPL